MAEAKGALGFKDIINRFYKDGLAYVGAVGSAKGVNEIAVLGSAANMFERLSAKAATGEILIGEDNVKSDNLHVKDLESRSLELKGVSQPVSVRALKV